MPRWVAPPDVRSTEELSQIAHEVSQSVEQSTANQASSSAPSKRMRHLERAKVQQLTRQLAMRLQYAKLKVDHGWVRQNLNEVENLYFHHHRATRPPVPQAITRRSGIATSNTAAAKVVSSGAASTSNSQDEKGKGKETSTIPTTNPVVSPIIASNASPEPMAAPRPTMSVNGLDPAVYSVDGVAPLPPIAPKTSTIRPGVGQAAAPNQVPPPPTVQQASRQAGRPRPYPAQGLSTSLPPFPSSSADPTLSPIHPAPSQGFIRPDPTSPAHPKTQLNGNAKHTRASGKSRAPPAPPTPTKLMKVNNKNTSTPSTLQPPQLSGETASSYKLPSSSSSSGMGSGTGAGAAAGAGPTSYESFWSSLSTGRKDVGSPASLGMRSSTFSSSAFSSSSSILGLGRAGSNSSATIDPANSLLKSSVTNPIPTMTKSALASAPTVSSLLPSSSSGAASSASSSAFLSPASAISAAYPDLYQALKASTGGTTPVSTSISLPYPMVASSSTSFPPGTGGPPLPSYPGQPV